MSTKQNDTFYENKQENEKRWCLTHPTGFWGKDQWGNWYERCSYGHKLNESCTLGVDDKVSER